MKKSKIITIASICSALVVALIVTLCCVFLIKKDDYKVNGLGEVVVTKNEDGTKTLTAKASKWNSFVGWYENIDDKKPTYTTEEINLEGNAPVYTAVFKTSPIHSINRLLSGLYYKYSDAIADEKDYFNFSGNIDLDLKVDSENFQGGKFTIKAGGYFNFKGQGNQLYLTVSPAESTMNMISLYYVDNTMQANIYAQVLGQKYKYNCESLSEVFTSFADLSKEVWSFESILKGIINNDETFNLIYPTIEQILGVENTLSFWSEAKNEESVSTFNFRIDRILKWIKDSKELIGGMLSPSAKEIFNQILTVLTGEYTGLLPRIDLNFVVDYKELNDIEYLDTLNLEVYLPNGYKLNVGEVVEVPTTDVSLKIKDLNMQFSTEANAIEESVLQDFPEAINMLNVQLDGEVNFIKEDSATSERTVTDKYALELDADLNPFAVLPGVVDGKFDATKVKWEKLGFLSLKISLVENPEDKGQMERHGNVKDYINLFIDTEKYGPKAMLFVGLYNPNISLSLSSTEMGITKNEVINASIDLKEFVKYLTNKPTQSNNNTEEPATVQTMSANIISSVVEDVATDNVHIENTLYKLLIKLLSSQENPIIPSEDISFDETNEMIFIALENIKAKLDGLIPPDVSSFVKLDLNKAIFGTDNTHISLSLNNFEYGTVARKDGIVSSDYVDNNGNSLFESYNEQHPTLLSVSELFINQEKPEMLNQKTYSKDNFVEEIKSSLQGQSIFAQKGIMSDDEEVDVLPNSIGPDGEKESSLIFKLLDVNVISQDETSAQVEYVLSLNPVNQAISLAGMFVQDIKDCKSIYEIIFKLANIPFVYTVTETIQFA